MVETGRFKYVYDACGRVTTKTESKNGYRPQTTKFIWNDEDRLTHIELPDGTRYRYRYDPFGRRIAKECERTQTQTHYLWDGNTVIQQSKMTADGTQLQSTEYLYEPDSFRPLAQITTDHDTGRERLHYIITDHAGTPQELCSPEGEIQWRGNQQLWGNFRQQTEILNRGYLEEAMNDAVHCDLRYLGQLEDAESGLYYNLNRYFDSDSGQYLSPDPIGFAGGLRPQGYVHNPVGWVDPLGLSPDCGDDLNVILGRVQSRINISNEGMEHTIQRHINPSRISNKSQFSLSESELRSILSSKNTVRSPVTALETGNYSRTITVDNVIGRLAEKMGGETTNTLTIITDKYRARSRTFFELLERSD